MTRSKVAIRNWKMAILPVALLATWMLLIEWMWGVAL
jgi:hypothetical protein